MKAVQKSCKDWEDHLHGRGAYGKCPGVEAAQHKTGNDAGCQGDQGCRKFLVVQKPQHQGENNNSNDEIDVVFGESAGEPI